MTMFPEYIIRDVADRNDIYDVVSKYVQLKKAGNSYIGLCPFHNEKTPSFSVSPQRGIFHCFGCGVGGDVISFVMRMDNIPFYEAVKKLADESGIVLPEVAPQNKQSAEAARRRKEIIYDINREAAIFFYEQLKESQKCIEYLKKRQLSGTVVKNFWLGYAPDSWNSLFDYLKTKEYTESEIFDAGLIKRHESGRYYDMFRNRLMFPIFDRAGHIIAFGGRVFDDSKPKYLNSPESSVFSKSRNLYAVNIATKSKQRFVMLTEGYMDTIALIKNGFSNTVATLGTALTAQQAKFLANNFSETVICYDGDNAGCMARLRAISMLREYDIKISVIDMGASKDPDEFIKANGVERFKVVLGARKNDMEYVMDYFAAKYDIGNPRDVVDYVSEVIDYLKLIKSSVERDVYVNMLSSRTKVSANAINAQLGMTFAKNSAPAVKVADPLILQLKKSRPSGEDTLNNAREQLLALIIFDKAVYNKHKDEINESIFESEFHIGLLKYIKECYETTHGPTPSQLTAHYSGDEDGAADLARILSIDIDAESNDKAYADYMRVIAAEMKKKDILALINSNENNLDELNRMLKNK